MSKKRRINLFLLALSLTLAIPEGLGEVDSVNKWGRMLGTNNKSSKTYSNNDARVTDYLNTYNSSDSVPVLNSGGNSGTLESTKRSASAQTYYYEAIPQYYGQQGQQCSYSGGKMVCKNRRDAGGGGSSYGGGGMDSYAAAAVVPASSYGVPMASGGWGATGHSEDEDSGIGGIGELAGLLGLLGLKGLKGLKGLAPLKLLLPLLLPLLPLLPILLPLLLLPLLAPLLLPLLLPLLILFFPIPVIVAPAARRGFSSDNSTATISGKIAEFATEILESDQCVERVSCEIARVGKTLQFDNVIQKLTKGMNLDSILKIKVKKGLTYFEDKDNQRESCAKFTCNSVGLNKQKTKPL